MSTLVFVEHHGNELQKGSLGVLAKAATLGDVSAVLVGSGVKALAAEAAKYGATKVHVAEDDALEPPLPQARVDVLAKVVQDGGYDTVLFANSVLAAGSRRQSSHAGRGLKGNAGRATFILICVSRRRCGVNIRRS